MKTTNAPTGKASLEKGLALFARIVGDGGRTKLVELAADLHLPRSTLYRLAGTLQDFGLVTRLARGRYDVGLRFAEKLRGIVPASQLTQASRPLLQRLADECHATAHLGVLENDMVTYLVKQTGASMPAAVAFTRENSQLEAYCSGIGKVLLAALSKAELARYLAGGPFVALTDRTITEPAELRACVAKVAADGWAEDDGEVADEVYCVAVPVPELALERRFSIRSAISLSFKRLDHDRGKNAIYLQRLCLCARAISLQVYGTLAPR